MNHTIKIFAIYKNGTHLGNEKGKDEIDAIKKFIIASQLGEMINDSEFVAKYNAIEAIKRRHHY
ncbi:hypothetical protein [Flavobacterium hiemivividum]|uniref:Uncharacterized protein n=1 Tax=Flavobacterium hiemivividum TaxID=2541734 RepID=A0A4V2Z1Y5_9FLAO|nr:hypothetical protein [Flavobacterium hiemivividum]TDE06748.1 hypothetical protein E0F98_03790 [Flavobacterium hiemivividum]